MFTIIGKFLNSKSQKISSAALIVALFALISRIFGLWRDRLLAGQFGAGQTLDIYYAAFKIPDLIYNLLIVGAISSAFIPVFHEYLTKDKDDIWRFVGNILNILLLALLIFSVILILFAPWLIFFIAPGFDQPSLDLTVKISRVLFLSPLLLGISALISALLQTYSRFLITSLAPIFYNLGIIFGIIFLAPSFGIWGLAYGVILGAFLHFIIQVPSLFNIGFKPKIILDFRNPGLIKIIKLWFPRTLGLLALQINSIVATAIASSLAIGSIAIFNFADNLRWVPIGIIGVAFSTAAFPAMSLAYAQGKKDLFLKRFSLAVRQTFFIVIPISLLFFVFRAQIVRIILGTGEFGWDETRLTAAVLGLFSFGIFAAALLPLFTRAFFAFHNTKTPVFINIISMSINVTLSFLFVTIFIKFPVLSHILANFLKVNDIKGIAILGLPLAITIASIINIAWHWFDLKKHIGDFGTSEIKKSLTKIIAASAIGVVFAYVGLYLLNIVFNTRTVFGLFLQTSGAFILAAFGYLITAFILKSEEILMLNMPATLFNWRGIKNPELTPGESLDDQY
ncbi:murein biosynthesis integral membrane protein MurJ [Candidatus Azambacteria bacterium RIFCSPHIGHO2_01_FULL_40_24]|uniref:Probable lipid II flippase MurJ n=1 Tax=Candidatus Azambacteria bacterium RIFCSPHIGHO2_01_FULL_40_24 TaxID=1797301 RepID=A0A1F5B448_9BACT|nr:MAG: murein biosynthesis integral membrane protein MurJ [Candidatus Azambacteria bacterium RIFCSPHIGHO2_01_FULL_40_24]